MAPPFDQIFPPSPSFTEKLAEDQDGRVVLVTGSTSADKISATIKTTKSQVSTKIGRVEALQLDPANLASIGQSAREFLTKGNRLDVFVHNAGLMKPPAGSKTDLRHDLETGTNLGPFLLNHYLESILKKTAAASNSPLGVCIVWISSMIAASVPKGGINMNSDRSPKVIKNAMENYMQSKAGNIFLAAETAQRLGKMASSTCVNSGLLKTALQHHMSSTQLMIMGLMLKEPKSGAYTELFASLSSEVTSQKSGAFIFPWGRFGQIPDHIQQSIENRKAALFYNWCDQETKAYQSESVHNCGCMRLHFAGPETW